MKNIWLPKDIEAGLFIIRESSPKKSKDLGFAKTVVFKIGFVNVLENDISVQKYCKISVLTDGFVAAIGNTKEEFANYLNDDKSGYRPLTKEEMIDLLNSSEQGFY